MLTDVPHEADEPQEADEPREADEPHQPDRPDQADGSGGADEPGEGYRQESPGPQRPGPVGGRDAPRAGGWRRPGPRRWRRRLTRLAVAGVLLVAVTVGASVVWVRSGAAGH